MIRILSAVLTVSAVGLSVGLAQAWDTAYRPGKSARQHQSAEDTVQLAALSPTDFQLAPQTAFDEFVERPLFSADRRPYEPSLEEPSALQPVALKTKRRHKKTRLSLTGVVINGEDRFALLRSGRDGAVVVLRAGGALEEWTLLEIHPESVKVDSAGEVTELALRTFETPPPPAKKTQTEAEPESTGRQVVASTDQDGNE